MCDEVSNTVYQQHQCVTLSALGKRAISEKFNPKDCRKKKTLHTQALDRSLDIIGKWGFREFSSLGFDTSKVVQTDKSRNFVNQARVQLTVLSSA